MLATREAHENVNDLIQRLLARVFESFHSITEVRVLKREISKVGEIN